MRNHTVSIRWLGVLLTCSLTANAQAPTVTPITGQKPAVEAIAFDQPSAAVLSARKASYTFTVTGKDWLDTKVTVAPGDSLTFTASGSVTLSDGRIVTPAGSARGWKDMLRSFPDNAADTGALIGRVGSEDATVPFAIGASKTLTVAATGDLYLRMNTSSDLTPTGMTVGTETGTTGGTTASTKGATFAVTMKVAAGAAPAPVAADHDLLKVLAPALFDSIPRRVQDQAGNPGDMVNFAFVGSQDQLAKAFDGAGWVTVDKDDTEAVLHGLLATLQHQSYTGVPISTLYLFGRPQDLSFERAAPLAVAAVRHHLRVWKSTQTVAGQPLWVGSATHDVGFERDERNGGITHHVDPKIDNERDFLEKSFAYAGVLAGAAYLTPSNPFQAAKTATGGAIQSDGRIVVMQLR